MMRLTSALGVAAMLLVACGQPDRPRVAELSSERGSERASLVFGDDAPSTSTSGEAADGEDDTVAASTTDAPASSCQSGDLRLLGSCATYSDGPTFASGAHCEEFYDARPVATKALEWACDCAKGIWSADPCAERVKSGECSTQSGNAGCTRMVACFPPASPGSSSSK